MITADASEPLKLIDLLRQVVEVEIDRLNPNGLADYIFSSADGRLVQVEREGAIAVLTSTLNVEDEIRRHMLSNNKGAVILLIEGIIIPTAVGCTVAVEQDGYFRKVRECIVRYEKFIAWLWQIQEAGVEVISTPNLQASAIALSAIYKNAQHSLHTTFRRHVKPVTSWHPNPVVMSLMGLQGADLGETKATQLAEKFGSIYGICTANEDEIASMHGWGKASARKVLRALGKIEPMPSTSTSGITINNTATPDISSDNITDTVTMTDTVTKSRSKQRKQR